ncbi:PRC and DUF2382 domain-containing protein [Deinococcus peraridilitoris]|uniref:Conserved domain protein, TIGR02271+C111 n=1 Tax=Deinococcus peraridilitoris (strain DSM 19664 / LMG 22246 / CIP 109416 / KR-200) TaxID=937777 RepID=L0A2S2_DEIPD|nr:DUF2382 domain-containing protein [Deinococcus peraridilitoris]AFZ67315.1 conserved domain protein, TIGR02271+C111 [Deinococcus peraridilitoris DSM 19664]
MKELIPLHDISRDHNVNFRDEGLFDPTGHAAYGVNGDKIGTVRSALADPETGRLRYLLVDVGGWFSSKEVLVPVGLARLEDDAVYFDSLTKEQVRDMHGYTGSYDYDAQTSDERILRGNDYDGVVGDRDAGSVSNTSATDRRYNYRDEDEGDRMFKTPERLRLLEERLTVDKERYLAGSVEVSKHVENRQEQVNVNLAHEEVVIERHPVTDPRPVAGNVTLGSDRETVRVDLEAERANVQKQAYVTEEVTVGERTVSETQTFTETVGKEVLDVNRNGETRDVNGLDDTGRRDER